MKVENKTKLPALKVNEGTLQGGFKSLSDLQKRKVRGGCNNCPSYNFTSCNNSEQME